MDIKLSNGATAFLIHDGKYLLMKRSLVKKTAPGVWSGVGGKLEQHELNDPKAACLREIEEETGIKAEHITNLRLRYIIIRRTENTIRQSYVYFGETDTENFINTDEGELYWIPENELLKRTYTTSFQLMLQHYRQMPEEDRVFVGVAENDSGQCRMVWSAVEDFDAQV